MSTSHLKNLIWCLSFIFCLTLHLGCTQNSARDNDSDDNSDLFSSPLGQQQPNINDLQQQADLFNTPAPPSLPSNIPLQAPPPLSPNAQGCLTNPLAPGCITRQTFKSIEEKREELRREFLSSNLALRNCALEVFNKPLAPEGSQALAQQQVDFRKKLVSCGQQIYDHNMQSQQWSDMQFQNAMNNFYYYSYIQNLQ